MEISWIFKSGCHLRVKSTLRLVLVSLIVISTMVLMLQTVYIHGKRTPLRVTRTTDLKIVAARNVVLSQEPLFDVSVEKEKLETEIIQPKEKSIRPFQKFGREACIVRFHSENRTKQYELINERNNITGKVPKYRLFGHPTKMKNYYNGNITVHVTNPGAYSITSPRKIYLMSAFARNLVQKPNPQTKLKQSDPGREIRHVVLVGWLSYNLINSTLRCCLLLENNTVVSFINEKRLIWTQVSRQPLMAAKFFCSVPKELHGVKIKGACMSQYDEKCLNKKFLAIEILTRQPQNSLAVCAKIAYGQLSAQRLIEWIEIQKLTGVDKVLMYYYNLNDEAMRVLLQYYKEGFVDLRPFDYPDSENNHRYIGQKDAQPFIDEQVVLYEALERLRGYTYAAVIDVDEVIYARTSAKHNLKNFVNLLLRKEPKAAGFSFRTELFITDWENKDDMGPELNRFWHARYQNRTRPLEDRTKNIIVMNRIILGSVWTHNYTALRGYKKYSVPASLGTLKHYRPCRKNWHCFLRRGYRDGTVAGLMSNIKNTVNKRFDTLLNNNTLSAIKSKAFQNA